MGKPSRAQQSPKRGWLQVGFVPSAGIRWGMKKKCTKNMNAVGTKITTPISLADPLLTAQSKASWDRAQRAETQVLSPKAISVPMHEPSVYPHTVLIDLHTYSIFILTTAVLRQQNPEVKVVLRSHTVLASNPVLATY